MALNEAHRFVSTNLASTRRTSECTANSTIKIARTTTQLLVRAYAHYLRIKEGDTSKRRPWADFDARHPQKIQLRQSLLSRFMAPRSANYGCPGSGGCEHHHDEEKSPQGSGSDEAPGPSSRTRELNCTPRPEMEILAHDVQPWICPNPSDDTGAYDRGHHSHLLQCTERTCGEKRRISNGWGCCELHPRYNREGDNVRSLGYLTLNISNPLSDPCDCRNEEFNAQTTDNEVVSVFTTLLQWLPKPKRVSPFNELHPKRIYILWRNVRSINKYLGDVLERRFLSKNESSSRREEKTVIDLALNSYLEMNPSAKESKTLDPGFKKSAIDQ